MKVNNASSEEPDGLLPDSQLRVANWVPEVRTWGEALRAFVAAQG